MKRLALFLALFCLVGPAGAVDLFRGRLLNPNELREHAEQRPLLYDGIRQQLTPAGSTYLPDRVYSVYHQGEKKWVYSLTNARGRFSEPFEFFYPGSIVLGNQLGADPRDTYVLTTKYEWLRKPTPFRQQLRLVLADPPFFKRINWYRTELPRRK